MSWISALNLEFKRILAVILLVSLSSCAGPYPHFTLLVPALFSGTTESRSFRAGQPLLNGLPTNYAPFAMTRMYGRWVDPHFKLYNKTGTYYGQTKYRVWWVEIQQGVARKTIHGIYSAKDGYEADLGLESDASARIYPRFQHKLFPWGEAVSFLVQYQNDVTNCAPCNGLLLYEVHGITNNGKYTIIARFEVTHPKLVEFGPKVREYRDDTFIPNSDMRRDRDYLLVEHCPDSEFQPSLSDIDAMLSTMKVSE